MDRCAFFESSKFPSEANDIWDQSGDEDWHMKQRKYKRRKTTNY